MKYKQLTREQRYAISLGIKEGKLQKAIALQIGVSASTVSRELRRNKSHRVYSYSLADEMSRECRERLVGNRKIDSVVEKEALRLLVREDWSPMQISGYLKRRGYQISHETLYKRIRADLSGELASHCRHKMKYRRHISRPRPTKATSIPNRTSIRDRPLEADGQRFGDWEMDLIIGKGGKGSILTLTERSSDLLLMEKFPEGKKAACLPRVVSRLLFPYRGKGVKTITTDNGSEFACHELITKKSGATVYFADCYCSWQKGAIENANKLVRQYIPKGTDFNTITDHSIKEIQKKINRRPREKLDFRSPKECFFEKWEQQKWAV